MHDHCGAHRMKQFAYEAMPGRIIFGCGTARHQLRLEIERLGLSRVLLIATEQELPLARELAEPLAELVVGEFAGVRPHVPIEVASEVTAAAEHLRADGLLSIGGGSTTGTAKAVALGRGIPIVAVPTTYAGSEVTPVWGRTEGHRKTTGRDPVVLPRLVVYDPELTLSLPSEIAGPSAMNAIAHCVEAFYGPAANPVTSLIAAEGISALAAGIRRVARNSSDLEGREQTLYGAWLAGTAFATAGSGLHHKICHALGGAFNVPHAETHTIVLPHVVAFNSPAIPAETKRVADALGVDDAAQGLQELARDFGTPLALELIGLTSADLDEAVAMILEKDLSDNPRPVDRLGLSDLLRGALVGRSAAARPSYVTG